jgi:SAM-dependent methyltransferase
MDYGQSSHAESRLNYTEFTDPRLVAIYDSLNPIEGYAEFYLDLAAGLDVRSIVDIGCGTGLLTFEFAKHGYSVIGVDPNPAMLDWARERHYDNPVHLIEGDGSSVGTPNADLTVMTGHVAQFFMDDEDWNAALRALHDALRPGGSIAFESRNPDAPLFAGWPTPATPRTAVDPVAGAIEWWSEILDSAGDRVRYDIHYRFRNSGEEIVSANELRFRSKAELERSLADAGFTVEHVYGDWDGSPVMADSPEMIFVAHR